MTPATHPTRPTTTPQPPPPCPGCFINVNPDWHTDPTLRAVVHKAMMGTVDYLKATVPKEVGNSLLALKEVSDFQFQVKNEFVVCS